MSEIEPHFFALGGDLCGVFQVKKAVNRRWRRSRRLFTALTPSFSFLARAVGLEVPSQRCPKSRWSLCSLPRKALNCWTSASSSLRMRIWRGVAPESGKVSMKLWSTTIIPFPGDNYNLPVVLGVICSSHVGVWFRVCPLGGTESSAPSGADDGVEPKGQTVAFLFPGSRCMACCARTLSPLNSKISA